MKTATLHIEHSGKKGQVWIRLFATRRAMRTHFSRWHLKSYGMKNDQIGTDTMAFVHPTEHLILEQGEWLKKDPFCLLYLNLKDLNSSEKSDIIAHEAIHVATTFYRNILETLPKLDPEIIDDEEESFAHMISDVSYRIRDFFDLKAL